MKGFLVLPHLIIQNANALSSPFTIGFPAITAWLGAVHALQRKFNQHENYHSLKFPSVGVVSHSIELQTFRSSGFRPSSILVTRNPLVINKKKVSAPSFVPEARCHIDVSLVIEVSGLDQFIEESEFCRTLDSHLPMLKFASGDLLRYEKPHLKFLDENHENHRELLCSLMPGYALIERRDLMIKAMNDGQDALHSILDGVCIRNECEISNGDIEWTKKWIYSGWIVPIAVGFHGLTELADPGSTLNQRDPSVPHIFAESVVTLGEFVMPYRLDFIENLLWYYAYEPDSRMYLCKVCRFWGG